MPRSFVPGVFRISDTRMKRQKIRNRLERKKIPVTGETIMMAPAAGFYKNPKLGKNQVRLAYVLCKEDLQRALMILEKASEAYNSGQNESRNSE